MTSIPRPRPDVNSRPPAFCRRVSPLFAFPPAFHRRVFPFCIPLFFAAVFLPFGISLFSPPRFPLRHFPFVSSPRFSPFAPCEDESRNGAPDKNASERVLLEKKCPSTRKNVSGSEPVRQDAHFLPYNGERSTRHPRRCPAVTPHGKKFSRQKSRRTPHARLHSRPRRCMIEKNRPGGLAHASLSPPCHHLPAPP